MIVIFLLTVVFITAAAPGSFYDVPNIKPEVIGSWALDDFSLIVRESILSAVSFPWETVKQIVEQILESGEDVDIGEFGKKLLTQEQALLVPACLGILLAALVLIITLLFCCCRRYFGKCGAKLSVQNVRKHKLYRMIIYAFIVLTMVGILSAMACCIPLSEARLKTSPRLIFRTMKASADDIPFFNMFLDEKSDSAEGDLNTAVDDIKADLDDLPNTLLDPVINGAKPFVTKIENKIDVISDDIDYLVVTETQLNKTVEDIFLHSDNLQAGINTINDLYSTIKADCISEGRGFCNSLPDSLGDGAMNINIDNTKLTDLAEEVTKLVAEAKQVNLTEYKTLGNSTFEEVPNTIRNASQSAIDDVKATLDTVQGDLEPEIDIALEDARSDTDFSDILNSVDNIIRQIEDNYHIIGTVFYLLGSVLGIIAMTALAGLLLGLLCTKKPKTEIKTGRSRAGHFGACLLMTAVGLAVFPLLFILLLGSVLMLLGGNLTVFCAPVQDLTAFRKPIDIGLLFGGESLGENFFNEPSLDLSTVYLFRTCRRSATIYSGLNFGIVKNLSSILNAHEFVPDFGDRVVDQINDTIRDISIVDTSNFDDLRTKLDLSDMDTKETQEFEDEVNGLDLEAKSREINDLADSIPDEGYADRYRIIGTALQDFHDDTKVPLKQSLDNLATMIDKLNSTSQKMKTIITNLLMDLDGLTNYIETQAVRVAVQAQEDFFDEMRSLPDRLINAIRNFLSTDIGQCKIVADIYDTLIASVCVHFLDALNVLWASLYTSGIVCTILVVSSCNISKYFRRPDVLMRMRNRPTVNKNVTFAATPSVSGTDVVLTNYKSSGDEDRSNNAVFPMQNYQRLRHKWRQRHRFITGPFSAQFFRVGGLEDKHMATEETVLIDSVQDADTKKYGYGVHIDSMVNDSVCLSQSLSSSEANSCQDTVLMVEESQNCIKRSVDTTGEPTPDFSKRDENDSEIVCSKGSWYQTETVCHISNEKQQLTYTKEDDRREMTIYPYLKLAGDEFILIPQSNMKIESSESNDSINDLKANYNDCQKFSTGSNDSSIDNDEWLRSYMIESDVGAEYHSLSPLVTYSSDTEKVMEQTDTTDKVGLSNLGNMTVLSNLGYIESDNDSVIENLDDAKIDQHVNISTLSNDMSSNLLQEDAASRYLPYQVVCSLCRKNGSDDLKRRKDEANNLSSLPEYSYKSSLYKGYEDFDQKIISDDSRTVRKSICNSDIGKISKSLEDNLHEFDYTFQNMSKRNKNTFTEQTNQQEQSDRIHDETNKTVNKSKLDIKVKPYRTLKKMKSPRSAFLFWKYIEANCSSPKSTVSSWPRESPLNYERYLKERKLMSVKYGKARGNDRTVFQRMSEGGKHAVKDVELLPEYKKNAHCTGISGNEPDNLQSLAAAAGRLAYVREEANDRNKNELVRLKIRHDRQPQSLANIAMVASSNNSDGTQMQEHRCEIATTIKNNTPVTYV